MMSESGWRPVQVCATVTGHVDESVSGQPHANSRRSVVMRVARSNEFVHERFNDKFVTFFVEVGELLDGQIDRDIC